MVELENDTKGRVGDVHIKVYIWIWGHYKVLVGLPSITEWSHKLECGAGDLTEFTGLGLMKLNSE